mmetsp:Transcript_126398/g.219071  ORF Transcript_126398/g.219071 Transcript_126398/m.219071 type:complete len:673 (+) Transcript_126398:110-2128(+)
MQPLGYLAARAIFGVLQLLEKRNRAFVRSESVALAAGVAHCWCIVFALIITNLTQAARMGDPVLPPGVLRIESMVVYSMSLWWITGMSLACIRALRVDEEMMGLPIDVCSAGTPGWLLALQSPALKKWLSVAMLLSCAGLFLSVLLLSCASAWMWSVVTVCELSLFMVTFGFALPYSAVAVQHGLSGRAVSKVNGSSDSNDKERRLGSHSVGALAAASEAATVGPQLCILLSLADIPESPSVWPKLLHVASASAFLASLVGCALAPPMDTGMAVPPSSLEVVACILLDWVTGMALTRYITGLSGWVYWILLAAVVVAALLLVIEEIRDFVMELLDPIMPLQHSANKRLPSPGRECARILSRVLALGCAVATLWNAPAPNAGTYQMQYAPPQDTAPWPNHHDYTPGYPYGDPGYDSTYHAGADYGHGDQYNSDQYHNDWENHGYTDRDWLLLRWREQATALQEEDLLNASAEAIAVNADTLRVMVNNTQHGVVLMEFVGMVTTREEQVRNRWEGALKTDRFVDLVNAAFPSHLDTGLCYDMAAHEDHPVLASSTGAPGSEATNSEATVTEGAAAEANSETTSNEATVAEDATIEEQSSTTSSQDNEFSWDHWYKMRWSYVGDTEAQTAYKAVCHAWRQKMTEDGDDDYREEGEYDLSGMAESVEAAHESVEVA